MDNLEEVLHSLNEFERNTEKHLSPELEELLQHIAKTGRTVFPWSLLKPLIRFKLEKVLHEFFESGSPSREQNSEPTTKAQDFLPIAEKLINDLNCFSGTPFTIQRICELITEPRKYYKTTDKFLRGVEKNILVVSTIQPDGSLITRSLGPPLTNGSASPTESSVNSMCPPPLPTSKPLHNSLLNTNFQENGMTPNDRLATAVEEAGEEAARQPVSTTEEESNFNTNAGRGVNATQNGHTSHDNSEQNSKPCTENNLEQNSVESEVQESSGTDVENNDNNSASSLSSEVVTNSTEQKPAESENEEQSSTEEKTSCVEKQTLNADTMKQEDEEKSTAEPVESENEEKMEH